MFFFLGDLNIKLIGNNIYTNVYDKCDDFGFLILVVNFPWLSGNVPRLPSYSVIYIVRFARRCTGVFGFYSKKIFKSLQNYRNRATDITSFGKRLKSSYYKS